MPTILAEHMEQLWDAKDASASGIIRSVHRILKACSENSVWLLIQLAGIEMAAYRRPAPAPWTRRRTALLNCIRQYLAGDNGVMGQM